MNKPNVRRGAAPDFSFGVRELLEQRAVGVRQVPPMAEWTLVEDSPAKPRRKTGGFDPYNSLGNANQTATKRSAWRYLTRR
jgi:hypothetical protein